MSFTSASSCPHFDNFKTPNPHSFTNLHKDECQLCFNNQKDSSGLDVCLECFNAFCSSASVNHTQLHQLKTSHRLVINIKQTLDGSESEEITNPPVKLTKLSVPAEEEEKEKWNTHYTFRCLECKVEIDAESRPELTETKTLIASSSTVNQKNQAKAWEEIVEPCPHVFDLVQVQNPNLDLSQTKCDHCDMSTNLWLCLTCGAIGCGRKQYDGSGGNNHGAEHFETTQHPISVKLGTITAEGEADTHCYVCGDMVQDPELTKHLAFHNILVNEQVKTELSMTELQLELNAKFDFNMTTEDGKNFEPRFGPNLTGLKNLGNSCYMASVLQCLVALDAFAMPFVDPTRDHYLTCQSAPAECVQCQLIKLVDGMISGQYSVPETPSSGGVIAADPSQPTQSQQGIAPVSFKHLIGASHPEFSTMRQQDAYEFTQYLQKTLSRTRDIPNVLPTFQFQMEQKLQCLGCQKVRYTVETLESLSVPLPKRFFDGEISEIELKECFDTYFQPNTISGYNCSTCQTSTEAVTSSKLLTFPEVLILNVRQFTLKNWVPVKVDAKVNVPTDAAPILSHYQAPPHPEGEVQFEEESETSGPQIDSSTVDQIMGMGFSKNAAERAIVNTGNSGAETAMNWLFEHMEDPQLNDPLPTGGTNTNTNTNTNINETDIENLVMMGFSREHSINALKATDSNLERAVEWIFSHPEGAVTEQDNAQPTNTQSIGYETPADYKLMSFINHKGTSVHCGHYISHVRHPEGFIMFNDNKVVSSPSPPLQEAYIYLFKRSEN